MDHERSVERCGVSLVASVKVGKQSPKVWRLQNILGKNTCNTLCIVYIHISIYIKNHVQDFCIFLLERDKSRVAEFLLICLDCFDFLCFPMVDEFR